MGSRRICRQRQVQSRFVVSLIFVKGDWRVRGCSNQHQIHICGVAGRHGCSICLCIPFLPIKVVPARGTRLKARLVTRATLLPNSKTMLVETPHVFMPFSKVRVMSAPLNKLSLSRPLYTGKGICRRLLLLKHCRSIRCIALAWTVPLYGNKC